MNNKVVYKPSSTGHWKELFPKKNMLLGAHNLNESERLVAEIERVSREEIVNTTGNKEIVPVIHFSGDVPPMVCNVSNANALESLYGRHYKGWEGKKVVIFVTEVKAYGGGKTMGLRIERVNPDDVIDAGQVKTIRKLIGGIEGAEQGMCNWLGVDSIEKIPAFSYATAHGAAKAKAKAAK